MEIKQTQVEFNSHLNALKESFSEVSENSLFQWDNIGAILMLTIKKNWTTVSSNSNYQINSENVKNFFPILQISDAFPHWRLSVPCHISNLVLNSFSDEKISDDWTNSNISYRHKIQNSYPYIQLTLENELRSLKNNLRENDQIFFLKDSKSFNCFVFAIREKIFDEESVLLTNPSLTNSDKTQFEISELNNKENKKAFEFNNIIYYGAPGTGKSHKIDTKIENLDNKYFERVTFHPEFDNASFIGGYKPKSVNVKYEDKDGEEYFESEVRYEFVAQSFTCIYERAWKDLENQHYLVIEEINRGNCAEIFGEIFQLLDRTSKYTVSPSKELQEYLEESFKDKNHLGIKNGLKLPPNLSILATMNTSDQSLFPMDSAFKRRWDWEYVPICYNPIDDFKNKNDSYDFEIDIEDGSKYNWIKFIEKINLNHIKNNQSLGMDKCIGNYFIKPDINNTISLKPFINKVIFYLWNDVFKDEDNKVFEENTSYEDFFPIGTNGKKKIKELFERIELKPIIEFKVVEDDSILGQVAEDTDTIES
jgi:hypothetical protein